MAPRTRPGHRLAAQLAAAVLLLAPLCGTRAAGAQTPAEAAAEGRLVRIEARFVDPRTGEEAPWGATGQILIAATPGDPAAERWRQVRAVASSPSRQTLTLAAGERGLIRVGREVPFAGWFLRHGQRGGLLDAGTEWRDVESALEFELAPPAADGTPRLSVTPEFGFQSGRARRAVAFAAERAPIALAWGAETVFVPPPELAGFYRRLLAGYDPLRRVWPVEMLLRAEPVEP